MQVCWLIPGVGTSQGHVRGGALLSSQAKDNFSDRNAALGKHVCRPLATQSGTLRGFSRVPFRARSLRGWFVLCQRTSNRN